MKTLLVFVSLLLLIYSCKLEETKNISYSHFGDTFKNWKQCYEEDSSEVFLVKSAHVELVKNPYDASDPIPFIKLYATLYSSMEQPDLKASQIFYAISIWNEETGQKVTYKGDSFDVCCGFLTNSSATSQQSLHCEANDFNCPSGIGDFEVSISKPLWKNLSGNYEASLVVFQYKPVDPIFSTNATNATADVSITVERDELVCIDVPLTLHFKSLEQKDVSTEKTEMAIFKP